MIKPSQGNLLGQMCSVGWRGILWVSSSPARLVAAMAFAATGLALLMALTSAINLRPDQWRGPPDEYAHRGAARYYVDHWLPPKVGDPASLDSYSRDYGFSYLNDTDPSYFLAGKFAALVSPIVPNHDVGFRLFNVTLLALLALLCTRRPWAFLVFVPLIISPQVWYIFSYFNGDGFALFLSVLLAYQVSDPRSAFNRYLDGPWTSRNFAGALVFAALAALLLLSKKNYFAFLAFVPAVIALTRLGPMSGAVLGACAIAFAAKFLGWISVSADSVHWLAAIATLAVLGAIFARASTRRVRAAVLTKLLVIAIVAGAFAAPRYLWDAVVNGSLEKQQAAIIQLQEQIAKPEYKPSTVYSVKPMDAYYGLELRARGTPLRDMFAPPWNWHSRTFITATGSYGWLQFNAPLAYYFALAAAYAALAAIYAWAVARSRNASSTVSFILVVCFSALTVGVSLFHSWSDDFQAQGRYLFPIVAILGAGLHLVRERIAQGMMTVATVACFALGVYSFVFVGLAQVPRTF